MNEIVRANRCLVCPESKNKKCPMACQLSSYCPKQQRPAVLLQANKIVSAQLLFFSFAN